MVEPIVDVEWVRAHRGEVVLADARCYLDGRSTREAYDAGHVPGAVYIDLERYLAAAASPAEGRHPLPSPETFADGMSRAGIGDRATVVAYDDEGGVMAARLVWMLRAVGESAALLDGDPSAIAEFTSVSEEPVPVAFTARPWPVSALATIDDAQRAAASGRVPVIDARPAQRFRGENDTIDPRPGHIPGARSVPCREHLVEGALRPVEQLRARFGEAGLAEVEEFISYCGSGVTACHNLIVAEHAGFTGGRLYPGSWSQYSADTSRPAATGD